MYDRLHVCASVSSNDEEQRMCHDLQSTKLLMRDLLWITFISATVYILLRITIASFAVVRYYGQSVICCNTTIEPAAMVRDRLKVGGMMCVVSIHGCTYNQTRNVCDSIQRIFRDNNELYMLSACLETHSNITDMIALFGLSLPLCNHIFKKQISGY